MSNFFVQVKQLPGKHQTNVFALLVFKLNSMTTDCPEILTLISPLILEIKVLFNNHVQDFNRLIVLIKDVLTQQPQMPEQLKLFLSDVLVTLVHPEFTRYFKKDNVRVSDDDLHCRIQRQFESNFAVTTLLHPSDDLLASVNKVSRTVIQWLEHCDQPLNTFLANLGPEAVGSNKPRLPLAFGRFDHTPTKAEVIELLKNSVDLQSIMLIHFMFIRDAYPRFSVRTWPQHLENLGGDFAKYFVQRPVDPREFFFNYIDQAPHLYTDRGRAEFNLNLSSHLGIMVLSEDSEKFPQAKTQWYPDRICQRPDRKSAYVRSLIESDIPYVAGPSGMTSLLSCAMTFLAQWKTPSEQQYYILAIVAFICGGGLHSIHEVLTIPRVRLGLLPSYRVNGPLIGNFQAFFELFNNDKIFVQILDESWKKTMEWMVEKFPAITEDFAQIATPTSETCSL